MLHPLVLREVRGKALHPPESLNGKGGWFQVVTRTESSRHLCDSLGKPAGSAAVDATHTEAPAVPQLRMSRVEIWVHGAPGGCSRLRV